MYTQQRLLLWSGESAMDLEMLIVFFLIFMLIYFLQNPCITLSLIAVFYKPSGRVEYTNYACMLSHSVVSDSLGPYGL